LSCGFSSLKALAYLFGECNYGGRVTDDKDRRLLMSLLSIFVNSDIVNKDNYKLSESGTYKVPPTAESQNDFIDYIRTLPMNPKPEVFGLHDNADITKDNQQTNIVSISHIIVSTELYS
jgi:dynein heavy chain